MFRCFRLWRNITVEGLVAIGLLTSLERPAHATPRQPVFGTDSVAPPIVDRGGLSAQAFQYRHWGTADPYRTGGGFGLGNGFETRNFLLFFGGDTRYTLRILSGVSLSLDQHIRTGVRLGPVRLETSLDFQSISIDRIDSKISFGMFSPGVGLAISFELPRGLLVRIAATEQYVWRWMGPDLRMHGLTLDVSRALPKW